MAIQEFESTITRALAGRPPSASRWRPIEADNFLRVVRDVAAFALTKFSSRSMAPICTMDVNRFACSYPIGGFARRLECHAPWSIDAAANTLTQMGIRDCGGARSSGRGN